MPKFQNILSRFFNQIETKYAKNEDVSQITLLFIFDIITIIFTLFIGIVSLFSGQYYISLVMGLVFTISSLNLLIVPRAAKLAKYVFISVLGLLLLFLILDGTYESVAIWYLAFPLSSFMIFGSCVGNFASLIFLTISIITLIVFPFLSIGKAYNPSFIIILAASIAAVHLILYAYEYFKNQRILFLKSEIVEGKKNAQQKDEFLSKLSHQIRTLLNNIMVVTNLLYDSALEKKQKDLIETIQASANNLANAINNISELSNIEIIESTDYNIEFDLESTLDSTLNLFTRQSDINVHFQLDIPPAIKNRLKGNPIKIKQIFLNLIENIIKNKTEGALNIKIEVQSKEEKNNHVLTGFRVTSDKPLKIQIRKTLDQFKKHKGKRTRRTD